jgi:hypothetical protein
VKVINLGEARDLLAAWEDVRRHILAGRIKGYALNIRDMNGKDTIYLAGEFKTDPAKALKASLRMSWPMTVAETGGKKA